MEFDEVLKERRSIRKFKDREIESEKLNMVLDAAKYAPSAHNLQDYEIYVVQDKEKKNTIMRVSLNQKFITEAPVVLVVCADTKKEGTQRARFYATQDATIVTYAMVLKAHDIGLSTCWVGAFDDGALSKVLRLPENLAPVAVLPLGYAAEKPGMPHRRENYVRKF